MPATHGLALGGIDLAGHDGRARLVGRKLQFTDTGPRPRSQHANIVGNFCQRYRQTIERAVDFNQCIMQNNIHH